MYTWHLWNTIKNEKEKKIDFSPSILQQTPYNFYLTYSPQGYNTFLELKYFFVILIYSLHPLEIVCIVGMYSGSGILIKAIYFSCIFPPICTTHQGWKNKTPHKGYKNNSSSGVQNKTPGNHKLLQIFRAVIVSSPSSHLGHIHMDLENMMTNRTKEKFCHPLTSSF